MSATMEDMIPSKDEVLERLRAYHACVQNPACSEREADEIINELHEMTPHANISDLIFWGERERTDEEIATESVYRERVWHEEGELALLMHIRSQLEQSLTDDSIPYVHRNYAEDTLKEISAQIIGLTN